MSSDSEAKSNAALQHVAGSVHLHITMDFGTGALTIAGDVVPIAVGQSVLEEALRTLEEKRRVAAAVQLRQAMADAQADADLRKTLSGGMRQ